MPNVLDPECLIDHRRTGGPWSLVGKEFRQSAIDGQLRNTDFSPRLRRPSLSGLTSYYGRQIYKARLSEILSSSVGREDETKAEARSFSNRSAVKTRLQDDAEKASVAIGTCQHFRAKFVSRKFKKDRNDIEGSQQTTCCSIPRKIVDSVV